MTQFKHANLSPGNVHVIHNWSVADTTARDALVVTVKDIGKVCRVVNDLYWLSGVVPNVWSSMGANGAGSGELFDGGSRLDTGSINDGGQRV